MIRKHPVLALVALILVLILVVFAVTGVIIMTKADGSSGHFQYLLVLGTAVDGTEPSSMLRDRIQAAYTYLLANPDVICIVSGYQSGNGEISEAECMYRELVELGIHPKRIWVEDEATSTWENLKFSLDLIEAKTGVRPAKIGVLSSEYHLFRASLFAKACDVEFVGIPARTSRWGQRINHFMREVAGVWHYLLLGGQYD